MSPQNNPWKILTTLIATFVTMLFGSASAKASLEQINETPKLANKLTVEERIAKVRAELSQPSDQKLSEQIEQQAVSSSSIASDVENSQPKDKEQVFSQYWNNWNNSVWSNY